MGGAEGAEKRQTLTMQTVKKDKLVTMFGLKVATSTFSNDGNRFPRKYFTKVPTDLSSEQIN